MNTARSTLVIAMTAVLGIAMPAFAQRAEGTQARATAKVNTERAVDAARAAREASKDARQAAKSAAVTGDTVSAQQAHSASVAAEDARNDAVEAAQTAEGAGDAAERGFAKRDAAAVSAEATRAAARASERAAANSAVARSAAQAEPSMSGSATGSATATGTVPASANASENARIATSAPGAMADMRHTTGAGRFHIDTNVLDTNHDGFLSREEASANLTLDADFATIDVNTDGRIATDELRSWIGSGGLAKNSRPVGDLLGGVGMANGFQMLDTDGDGAISTSEARVQARLDARFRTLDRNRDGRLSQAEYDAFTRASTGKR